MVCPGLHHGQSRTEGGHCPDGVRVPSGLFWGIVRGMTGTVRATVRGKVHILSGGQLPSSRPSASAMSAFW